MSPERAKRGRVPRLGLTKTKAMKTILKMKYPYKEGDDYYTIEQNLVIRSCWDDISEEMHTYDSIYYSTKEEALLAHYKTNHNK